VRAGDRRGFIAGAAATAAAAPYGWLTHVAGLRPADLATNVNDRSASTARMRWTASVGIDARRPIEVEPRGGVVEIGRLVIAPEPRGAPARVALGALFAQAWHEVRSRGYVVLAGAASKGLVERFNRSDFRSRSSGPRGPTGAALGIRCGPMSRTRARGGLTARADVTRPHLRSVAGRRR
jgi:hypothetical protein